MTPFKKAEKHQAKLRLALVGPSGGGKTYSALLIARGLVGDDGSIAVVDTERGSASLYADEFSFDTMALQSFHPQAYIDAIKAAADADYGCVILDSLSHAWMGKDGALELVDKAAKKSQSRNSFTAWREVTPIHNALVDAILQAPLHVIATMRSKTEYVIDEDEKGKKVPRKVGMAPIQRDGMEYEFTIVGDLTHAHDFIVSKTRCRALTDAVIHKPGIELGKQLRDWLGTGAPMLVTKTFEIQGRSYITQGIDKEQLLEVWSLGADIDKAYEKGTAKHVIETATGKASSIDLTATEAVVVIGALKATLEPPAQDGGGGGEHGAQGTNAG